jgi:tRNA pseudouridine38-40 synthase
MLQSFKMTIAYDGTAYCGWQRQVESVITVQSVVEKAIGEIVSQPVIVRGASRTDAGVHAEGQVALIQIDTQMEPERLRRAINSRLPEDVLIVSLEIAPEGFDVRWANRKRYRYLIWSGPERTIFYRNYVYQYYHKLQLEPMQAACKLFEGTHDFEAFRGRNKDDKPTVRKIFKCGIHQRGPLLIFAVEGNGFLYHMVRTMVGTILEVGRGYFPPEHVTDIIASKDRNLAGTVVPAEGLCLQWIQY